MDRHNLFKEFKRKRQLSLAIAPVSFPIINAVLTTLEKMTPLAQGVTETRVHVTSEDDQTIPLTIFTPDNLDSPAPCLLYFYGSALFMKRTAHHTYNLSTYAAKTRSIVIAVDYRLSPQHVFPTPLLDCDAVATWVFQQATRLGIDTSRIAVGGDSAGGMFAACVALMRRNRGDSPFCFQFLIYPMTDYRMDTPSMKEFDKKPYWSNTLNKLMWSLYVNRDVSDSPYYLAPLEEVDFQGLSHAYIEMCEIDPLRDEGLAYAEKLRAAGFEVDTQLVSNSLHGFDIPFMRKKAKIYRKKRIQALSKAFYSHKNQIEEVD